MSSVHVKYDSEGFLILLSVSGHSGIARIGSGLEVCIALSTLAQSLVFALHELLGSDFYKCVAESGNFVLECDLSLLADSKKNDYKLIIKSYLVGIKKLSKEYQDYIKYMEG